MEKKWSDCLGLVGKVFEVGKLCNYWVADMFRHCTDFRTYEHVSTGFLPATGGSLVPTYRLLTGDILYAPAEKA